MVDGAASRLCRLGVHVGDSLSGIHRHDECRGRALRADRGRRAWGAARGGELRVGRPQAGCLRHDLRAHCQARRQVAEAGQLHDQREVGPGVGQYAPRQRHLEGGTGIALRQPLGAGQGRLGEDTGGGVGHLPDNRCPDQAGRIQRPVEGEGVWLRRSPAE